MEITSRLTNQQHARFRDMPPDPTECGCMKTIVLFKPETGGLAEPRSVEVLQDQAQCILADYVRNRYISQPTRYLHICIVYRKYI